MAARLDRPFARVCGGRVEAHDAAEQPAAWWSITKLVIAAAILRLVERGEMQLEDLWPGVPVTVRQILQHTSGLPDYGDLADYHRAVEAGDTPWPVNDLFERVRADRLLFRPGAGWRYSNVGYLHLRLCLEAVVEKPWGEALDELVLAPLGVTGVRAADEPFQLEGVYGVRRGYHPGWVYHGLLVGPASAAALMLDGLLGGRLLDARLTAEMRRLMPIGYTVPDRPVSLPGCGLGVMGEADPAAPPFLGHSGGGPGGHSTVNAYPDLGMTVAVFAQEDEMSLGALETLSRELASA